jgi:hypothetical protein
LSLYGWAYANKVANAGLISLMNPCRKHISVSVLFGDAAWIANLAAKRVPLEREGEQTQQYTGPVLGPFEGSNPSVPRMKC